ncbi:hypothetical protein ONN26_24745, partial [Salmonella enterica subsp. enterica serovar Muenster]|nr:hypothetical protein [Salmonella enterica subsp. enterica serovar Muenster]
EHCVKKYHWIQYGTLNIFSFERRTRAACRPGCATFRRVRHPGGCPVLEPTGPLHTQFGYHIIKVLYRK